MLLPNDLLKFGETCLNNVDFINKTSVDKIFIEIYMRIAPIKNLGWQMALADLID